MRGSGHTSRVTRLSRRRRHPEMASPTVAPPARGLTPPVPGGAALSLSLALSLNGRALSMVRLPSFPSSLWCASRPLPAGAAAILAGWRRRREHVACRPAGRGTRFAAAARPGSGGASLSPPSPGKRSPRGRIPAFSHGGGEGRGGKGPPSPCREPLPAFRAAGSVPAAGLGPGVGSPPAAPGPGACPHPPRERGRATAPRPGLGAGGARLRRAALKSLSSSPPARRELGRTLPSVGDSLPAWARPRQKDGPVWGGWEAVPSLAGTARTCRSSSLASCTSSSSALLFFFLLAVLCRAAAAGCKENVSFCGWVQPQERLWCGDPARAPRVVGTGEGKPGILLL